MNEIKRCQMAKDYLVDMGLLAVKLDMAEEKNMHHMTEETYRKNDHRITSLHRIKTHYEEDLVEFSEDKYDMLYSILHHVDETTDTDVFAMLMRSNGVHHLRNVIFKDIELPDWLENRLDGYLELEEA